MSFLFSFKFAQLILRYPIKDLCPPGAGLILLYVPGILKFRTVVSVILNSG